MSIVSFESRDEKNISHAIANFLTAYETFFHKSITLSLHRGSKELKAR